MKTFLFATLAAAALMVGTSDSASAHGRHGGFRHGGGVGIHFGSGYNRGHFHYGNSGWGHSHWHNTGHYDYVPGGVYRHGNHYHYQPGGYLWHNTGHWHHH